MLVDQSNKVLFEKEIKEGMGVKRQTSHIVTQKEKSAKKGGNITPSQQSSQGDAQIQIDQEMDEQEAMLNDGALAQTNTHLKIADKDLRKI